MDYLRRLEPRLRAGQSGSGRLRAIGVLGTDVYDKLLILRALRPGFPGVVFFTTDLDAQLLQPGELEWTRNLIVASPFNLQLPPDFHSTALPFRDCYQSSTFFVVSKILNPGQRPTVRPHVYELGPQGLYEFRTPDERPTVCPDGLSLPAQLCAVPGPVQRLLFSLAVLASVSVLYVARDRKKTLRLLGLAVLLAVPPAFVVSAGLRTQESPDGEPFLIAAGISAWPTELLRAVALSLTLGFIVLTFQRLECMGCAIEQKFFAVTSRRPQGRHPGPVSKLRSRIRLDLGRLRLHLRRTGLRLRLVLTQLPVSEVLRGGWRWLRSTLQPMRPAAAATVPELWQELRRRRSFGPRFFRVALGLVLFCGFFGPLFQWLGPAVKPLRGASCHAVDRYVLASSSLALEFLLLYLLDVTCLCNWFARELLDKEHPPCWRAADLEEVARQRGLGAADVCEWQNIQLVATYTEGISALVYYPCVVLLILIVARHRVFDDWSWPLPLLLVFGVSFLLAAAVAFVLRYSAKSGRSRLVRAVRKRARSEPSFRAARLETLADEIEAEQRGAFSHVVSNPVLRASLIPSSGIGLLKLLEVFWHGA